MEVRALSWDFLVLRYYTFTALSSWCMCFHGASLGASRGYMLGFIMLSWTSMILPLTLMGLGVGVTSPPKPIVGAEGSRSDHVDAHGVVACEAVGPSEFEVGAGCGR